MKVAAAAAASKGWKNQFLEDPKQILAGTKTLKKKHISVTPPQTLTKSGS